MKAILGRLAWCICIAAIPLCSHATTTRSQRTSTRPFLLPRLPARPGAVVDCPIRIGFVENSFYQQNSGRISGELSVVFRRYFERWKVRNQYDFSWSPRGEWEVDVVNGSKKFIYLPMGVDLVFDISEIEDGFDRRISLSMFTWSLDPTWTREVAEGRYRRWQRYVGAYAQTAINRRIMAPNELKNLINDQEVTRYMRGLQDRCQPVAQTPPPTIRPRH